MTQEKIKQIHRWYGWSLAVVLIVLGVLVILSCLNIYTSGPRPYSAEAIALRFQRIALPVFIGVAGIVGGIALDLLLPFQKKRGKGIVTPDVTLLRLRQKVNIPPVQKEIRLRRILRTGAVFCFTGLMVYPMIYFLDPAHFSVSNLNHDVVKAVLVALIPAGVGLTLCWVCRALVHSSFRREVAVYKQALAAGQREKPATAPTQPVKCTCSFLNSARLVIIGFAIILIILGVFNGGAEDVLKKAIAICTECIGLG